MSKYAIAVVHRSGGYFIEWEQAESAQSALNAVRRLYAGDPDVARVYFTGSSMTLHTPTVCVGERI